VTPPRSPEYFDLWYADVVTALRLPVGGTLLDLACGRGGYGLEDASVDGVLCVDAVQFAEAPAAAFDLLRRVMATATAPPG